MNQVTMYVEVDRGGITETRGVTGTAEEVAEFIEKAGDVVAVVTAGGIRMTAGDALAGLRPNDWTEEQIAEAWKP